MLTTLGAGLGTALGKRWAEEQSPHMREVSTLAKAVLTLDFIIFLPLFILVNYTLGSVFTTLAVVENPDQSPSYAALRSLDDEEGNPPAETEPLRKQPDEFSPVMPDGIVTASLRSTCRHLYRTGGIRMFFRGVVCAWVIFVLDAFGGFVFLSLPFIFPFGRLVAYLALAQLHTVWVHIVISDRPNGLAFWRRLPPFGKTFNATKYAVALFWLADTVTAMAPYLVALFVNGDGKMGVRSTLGFIVLATAMLLIRAPAFAILTRVQASLLPSDEGTIVSFDRSFGGHVDPSANGSHASVSIRDAWKSLSRASMIRIYKMFIKTILVNAALIVLVAVVVSVQILFLRPHESKH